MFRAPLFYSFIFNIIFYGEITFFKSEIMTFSNSRISCSNYQFFLSFDRVEKNAIWRKFFPSWRAWDGCWISCDSFPSGIVDLTSPWCRAFASNLSRIHFLFLPFRRSNEGAKKKTEIGLTFYPSFFMHACQLLTPEYKGSTKRIRSR